MEIRGSGKIGGQTFLTTGQLRVRRGGKPTEAFATEGEQAASFALAIRATTPNPAAGGRLRVQLELRDNGAARLDVIDLAGRLIASRDVGRFGPGRHEIDLENGGRMRPGIYFLRLRQGAAEDRSRVVVLP